MTHPAPGSPAAAATGRGGGVNPLGIAPVAFDCTTAPIADWAAACFRDDGYYATAHNVTVEVQLLDGDLNARRALAHVDECVARGWATPAAAATVTDQISRIRAAKDPR